MSRRLNQGFNLVEILITLTLIALLTTTLINFVNDFDDKTKVVRARNDLMRMAQQAVIAESKAGQQISTASSSGSSIMTLLRDYLVELPDYDPWGNRFVISDDGTVTSSDTQGQAYIVDPSFGRMICAGPDGTINTILGEGLADTDNDIVIEFRQQPWISYSYTPNGGTDGEIWVARLDGSGQGKVLPHPSYVGGSGAINVTYSPDGSRWAGVEFPLGSERLIWGNTSPVNPSVKQMAHATEPGAGPPGVSSRTYPMFLPDGNQVLWITDTGALWIHNIVTGYTDQLLPDNSVLVDSAPDVGDPDGRIVHTSRERSYYWKANGIQGGVGSIGIAVSSDGKIAVGYYGGGGKEGIYLLLPGSAAQRLLKETVDSANPLENWMPMFWEDTNDLIYWGRGPSNSNIVRRIAQDGRFDIPLYGGLPINLGPRNPAVPSISPDGSLVSFAYDGTDFSTIVRSDGGGFMKGSLALSQFPIVPTVSPFQSAMWAPDQGSMFLLTDGSGVAGITEVNFRLDSATLPPLAAPPTFNGEFNVAPIRSAMSPNGLMIAAVSTPGIAAPQEAGVFVFPILGPYSAKVTISETEPGGAAENIPNITWIDN